MSFREGFETATRAAAAGGVTCIVDMPLNSIPPTTTRDNFAAKVEAAKDHVHVDVAFWGGIIPRNQVGHQTFPCLHRFYFKNDLD